MDLTNLEWRFSGNSSGGQYLKAERIINNEKFYYKLSDYSYGTFLSHESVLEVIASRLGQALGLPVLKYEGNLADILIDNKKYTTFVTWSKNYCRDNESSMSLLSYYNGFKSSKEYPLQFCKRVGLEEFINQIFVFDYLIMNDDRHGRNIEVISNGVDIRPAPIFDNGKCLTYKCSNSLDNILSYNYKQDGEGNNFIGGINLKRNLKYIQEPVRIKSLKSIDMDEIFKNLDNIIKSEHKDIIVKTINYRYSVLLDLRVIIV